MMVAKPEDTAFPMRVGNVSGGGLTKREYLSACALQGLLADGGSAGVDVAEIAEQAVTCAEALIDALNVVRP